LLRLASPACAAGSRQPSAHLLMQGDCLWAAHPALPNPPQRVLFTVLCIQPIVCTCQLLCSLFVTLLHQEDARLAAGGSPGDAGRGARDGC